MHDALLSLHYIAIYVLYSLLKWASMSVCMWVCSLRIFHSPPVYGSVSEKMNSGYIYI